MLTDSESATVSMLSPEGRYDYFVENVTARGEVWSLECGDGWVVMTSEDGEECLPVWPNREFAAQWATEEWSDCTPRPVPLDAWTERWTPGMEKDGTLVAVFPNDEGEGSIVSPGELADSLAARRRARA